MIQSGSDAGHKIGAQHLARTAFVYVRQSTFHQVRHHLESQRRQYDLVGQISDLGWPRERIVVVDEDQGKSGASAGGRGRRAGRPARSRPHVDRAHELTGGAVRDEEVDGHSLLLARHAPQKISAVRPFFCSVVSQKATQGSFFQRAVRSGKWVGMQELRSGENVTIYDAEADPGEQEPVVANAVRPTCRAVSARTCRSTSPATWERCRSATGLEARRRQIGARFAELQTGVQAGRRGQGVARMALANKHRRIGEEFRIQGLAGASSERLPLRSRGLAPRLRRRRTTYRSRTSARCITGTSSTRAEAWNLRCALARACSP